MATWARATLGDLVDRGGGEIKTGPFGSQLHESDYIDDPNGVPVVMPKDMIRGSINYDTVARISRQKAAELDQHITKVGDLLIPRRGDLTRQVLIREPDVGAFCGTGSLRVRLADGPLTPRFLLYYLQSEEGYRQLESKASGVTMPNISTSAVKEVIVRFPDADTQHAITSIVAAYDELMENNRRRIEILEEMAQAIYREWFVNFRFPGHENVAFNGSNICAIPENWSVVAVGDVANFEKGLSYKGAHLSQGGLPMANLKCFAPRGGFRRAGLKTYDGPFKERHAAVAGDIVVANTDLTQAGNIVGRAVRLPRSVFRNGGLLTHHLFRVRMKEGTGISPKYLFGALDDPRFRDWAKGHASGTTVLGFRREDAERYPLIIPPPSIMERFEDHVGALWELVEVLEDECEVLQTRDLLLPKLITGEIDVSDLDIDTSWLAA